MAPIEASFDDHFTVKAPLDRVREHFASAEQVARHYGKLDRYELRDPHTVRFVQPSYNYGVTRFDGRYTCRYQVVDDHTVRWSTLPEDHNMENTGTARLSPGPGGSTLLHYQATLAIDLDVNRILRATLAPVVSRIVAEEMRGYVKRMIATVEAAATART